MQINLSGGDFHGRSVFQTAYSACGTPAGNLHLDTFALF
jgi:hypothetical protein